MLDSSKILFSAAIVLAIGLSTCHIVKRKAPDGQLYIFSSREGCESVQSEGPCTLTWQLNPYFAEVYKQRNEKVAAETRRYRSIGVIDSCIQAVENASCSQVVPRCSPRDGSRDYGDVSKLCQDIYNFCSQSIVNDLEQENFCKELKTGKHLNSPCVAPSLPVTGVCPQPKYKMPSEFLANYRKKSAGLVKNFDNLRRLKYGNGEIVFSTECINLLVEIGCSPLYCSADETKLLIKHDRDDCKKTINECFGDVLSRLSDTSSVSRDLKAVKRNLEAECDIYPIAANSELMAEPPALPNSAASYHFGHPIAFVAIIASFIVKLYV